jgi:dienelactone hydrolase
MCCQVDGASAVAGETASDEIDLPPPSGQGRLVLILSGIGGTGPYKEYAEKIAKLGYYAVVIDGLSADQKGADRLQTASKRRWLLPVRLQEKSR